MFIEMAKTVASVGCITLLGDTMLKVLDKKFHAQLITACGFSVASISVAKYVVWRVANTPDWVTSLGHIGDFINNIPFIN